MSVHTNFQLSRTNKVIAFIDYKPAELRKGTKDWIIVYYARNPVTQQLERLRLRAPVMSNARQRELHANKIVASINKKLAEGWSPWLESNAKTYKPFREAQDQFMLHLDKEIKDGIKREDTRRTYQSFISMINTYIAEKGIRINFALELNHAFATDYLDWIYYDRNNSPRTYNNHLLFLKTFGNFCISKGYLKENPVKEIANKRPGTKKRVLLSDRVKKIIKAKLPLFSKFYFTLCMMPYYAMVRRTELTKLKVIDIDLERDVIYISGAISKSGRDECVTIPAELKPLLARQVDGANRYDYIFSANDFKPGPLQLAPKKISDTWTIFKKQNDLPDNVQWYSFKDTGITDLFELGVSSLKIRDQARHKELKTTEIYTPRSKGGERDIVDSGIKF